MKKHINSLFAVLAVIILLASCTTGNPFIKAIQTSIDSKNYTEAVSAADTAIAKDPLNGTPHYYKAVALGKIAEAESTPANRKPTYEQMRASLMEARTLYAASEKPGAESFLIDNLILSSWSIEHNAGIKYATDDSIMASVDAPLELSIAHLVNATTINPDSVLSFDVLAQIYYMNKEYDNAAKALSSAIELQDVAKSSEYDRLSSYYFLNEEPDKAVSSLEEALEIYPDSVSLIQKLADGLFQIDRTDEALDFMNKLIESDPNNARYKLVVGTRIYQRVLTLNDQAQANSDKIFELERNDGSEEEINKLKMENETLLPEIKSLTESAEDYLVKAAELDATIPNTFNTLGILYQNKAASLYDLRNNTLDNDKADEIYDLAQAETRKAMVNYEKAAELNPDNTGYWQSLFRIYTLLDMREKAEDAMNKAGM